MNRFDNIKERVGSVGRGTWLMLGLIIVAAVIGAMFAYGEPDELAENSDSNEVVEEDSESQEQSTDGTDAEAENGARVADDSEESGSGNDGGEGEDGDQEVGAAEAGQEEVPGELADTGPVLPLAGAMLLGGSGYYYYRSRRQVQDSRR